MWLVWVSLGVILVASAVVVGWLYDVTDEGLWWIEAWWIVADGFFIVLLVLLWVRQVALGRE